MKFSVIICTYNRTDYILNCINSVLNQSYKDFEIIVIDQSDNDNTKNIIMENIEDNIIYSKINQKGLSLSRNIAIKISSGEYVCFLDDDAEYSVDVLEKAAYILTKNPNYIGIMGKIIDKNTKKSLMKFMDENNRKRIPYNNHCKIASSSLILNKKFVVLAGNFDENFGIGARYGACEDNDLISKIMYINKEIYYIDDIIIYHPFEQPEKINYDRAFKYSMGYGALCKKHFVLYNNGSILLKFVYDNVKILIKTFIFLILFKKEKMNINYYQLKGNIKGFIQCE